MIRPIDERLSPELAAAIERFQESGSPDEASIKVRGIESMLDMIDHRYECGYAHIKRVLIEAEQGGSILSQTSENIASLGYMESAYVEMTQIAMHLIEYIMEAGRPAHYTFKLVMAETTIDNVIAALQADGVHVEGWELDGFGI